MEEIKSIDFNTLIVGGFMILAAVNAMAKIIGDFSKLIGHPIKWVRKKEEETNRINDIAKCQAAFEGRLESLSKSVTDLTEIVVDDRIDRMRYEILDMASAIAETKRWYSVEQIRHTIKIYDEYENFLRQHNKTNGEIEMSIKIIKDAYMKKYEGMFGGSRNEESEKETADTY